MTVPNDKNYAADRTTDDRTVARSRALAVGSRAGILRALEQSETALTVTDIADHVGLHQSTVHQHLAVLVDAGLVSSRSVQRNGRGRPRTEFTAVTEPDPYQELAVILAAGIDDVPATVRLGRAHGARIEHSPDGPVETLRAEAERLGFEPVVRDTPDGTTEVVLMRCPFARAADVSPAVVCGLHRGIAEGIIGESGGMKVVDLVVEDPDSAGCRIVLRRTADDGH